MTLRRLDVPYAEDEEAQLFVAYGWMGPDDQKLYGVEAGGFYLTDGEAHREMIAGVLGCTRELVRLTEHSAMKKLRRLPEEDLRWILDVIGG